jgi:hypothetical protein
MWWLMRYDFVLSEGSRYQHLTVASRDLDPRAIPGAAADGLDGWSFLMRTARKDFALVYFENKALRARMKGFSPGASYRWTWFDPRTGQWGRAIRVKADASGVLPTPSFSAGGNQATNDVAAKIVRAP